jgi:hypothetical protein
MAESKRPSRYILSFQTIAMIAGNDAGSGYLLDLYMKQ